MRLFCCALVLLMTGCSTGNRYHVSGNIIGGGNERVRLLKYTGQKTYLTVDSTVMKGGKFAMKGSVGHPVNVILGIGDRPYSFGFWLENSRINLTAHTDSVYRARVSGSMTDMESDSISKFLEPYDRNCRQLNKEANLAINADKKAWMERQIDSCWKSKKDAIVQYIKDHNNSFPAAALIRSVSYALTWQELDDIINTLSPEVAASEEIGVYKERVERLKTVDIGRKAPDFTIPDTSGTPVNLYKELAKTELMLVDFWAAWCGPCRRENPNLVKAYQRFHDKGFEIIAISLDKRKEDWEKAIAADGLPWIHVSNLNYWDDPVLKEYVIHSVPSNVLLDKQGNIVARNLKGAALMEFLESRLQGSVRQLNIKGIEGKVNVAVTAKLTGTGRQQLLTGSDSLVTAYQIDGESAVRLFAVPVPGSVQKLAVMDANGDGRNDIIAVTGRAGYAENIDVEVYLLTNQAPQGWNPARIYTRKSPRPQISFLEVADMNKDGRPEILVSYFESKYNIETVELSHNEKGWQSKVVELRRMAMTRAIGNLPGYNYPLMVAGRPYGDSLGTTGDAYLVSERLPRHSPSSATALPSFRGVKAIQIGDGDNDGKNEIFMSDGWHQDYGKIARGRLAVVQPVDTGFVYKLIEDVKGQHEISQIMIADINGDRRDELITSGNRYLRIYSWSGNSWKVFCDENIQPGEMTIGDINGDQQPDLILSAKGKLRVYNLKQIHFSSITSGELITEVVNPATLIGKAAPELKVDHWYNGKPLSLEALKGKVVVLDFWATWCKPCIKLFPQLKEWQKKNAEKGLVILGLTREDDIQKLPAIEDFINKENFPYHIAVSAEPLNNLAYGVGGIPHVVLIDRKGIVRKFKVGSGESPEFEAALLKCLEE